MTPMEVELRVIEISGFGYDPEAAHSMEDKLYIDVLREIAEGASDPAKLAVAALATQDLKFDRWCG